MTSSKFERIVDEYGDKLFRYLMRFLANRDDAEDILQGVFLGFYKQMDSVDPAKYSSYLYRAAHNQAINYKKKRRRYVYMDPLRENSLTSQEEPEQESNETNIKIAQALQRLKPKEALAVELQFYQKKSYEEIAGIMGTTSKAVDSLLVRAKRKLRKYLQDINR